MEKVKLTMLLTKKEINHQTVLTFLMFVNLAIKNLKNSLITTKIMNKNNRKLSNETYK